ncbi:TfoX/Sxy family protein [Hansschlegelia sp. KR7-227]|jgi:DNA transformation protein|uniref:TfoX/Sxy family protein n=1 Tax=Hansschlegelia sp. KR7-227 TaxID=3400914 RepID=UPI003C06D080
MALDPERAAELFAGLGPVRCRRMFGGTGVYSGDVMFALEARDTLYLKSDATTDAAFDAEGCEPFSYETGGGRRVITSYRLIPARLLDDPDDLAPWAERALAVARRVKLRKR